MLKQSTSRNQRSKALKIKHALQICLLLVISIWILHQLKLFLNNESKNGGIFPLGRPETTQIGHEDLRLSRKSLIRQGGKIADTQNGRRYETEQYSTSEIEGGEGRDENSEIDREDEEPERIEDLMDENSEEAEDGSDQQEEAIDSSESSFDQEGNQLLEA
ncbi:hypothetical protein Nepgr_005058 [Nepenthes gracilis]|uniref:Uncharacterized protein n=1 Tax=Nepenthes gracilis TaxID=150966 RepID=A0AAD3S2Z2_NEPGR|nr:hypothetical protein Nepgr_005058 [Nepenthes gracilis]